MPAAVFPATVSAECIFPDNLFLCIHKFHGHLGKPGTQTDDLGRRGYSLRHALRQAPLTVSQGLPNRKPPIFSANFLYPPARSTGPDYA